MAVAAATVARSELAGFARDARWARAAAIVIDTFLFSIIAAFVNTVYGVTTITSGFGAQRLGDLAAGTTVVYRHRAQGSAATRSSSSRARVYLAAALGVAVIFSVGFDYIGRPPLVVEGLYNTHSLLEFDVTSYSLGGPTWGNGTVTYPITFATTKKSCAGTVTLQWQNFGWQLAGARYTCPPS